MIKGVIFDLEGVIFDTEKLWDIEITHFLNRFGVEYNRAEMKHNFSGRTLESGVEYMKTIMFPGVVVGNTKELARDRWDFFQKLCKGSEATFIDGFEDFYNMIGPYFRKVVATSMNQNLLDGHYLNGKLFNYFNNQVVSVDNASTHSKPDPHVNIIAANKIALRPDKCVVIEDSPKGIAAALKSGAYCIGLGSTYSVDFLKEKAGENQPHLIVPHFRDLTVDMIKNLDKIRT